MPWLHLSPTHTANITDSAIGRMKSGSAVTCEQELRGVNRNCGVNKMKSGSAVTSTISMITKMLRRTVPASIAPAPARA